MKRERLPPPWVGQKFTRLRVKKIEWDGRKTVVVCRCICGETVRAAAADLRRGKVKSCGCWIRDIAKLRADQGAFTRHGDSRHGNEAPEYRAWSAMRYRCNNPNAKFYPYYGGRGIKVCDRWNVVPRAYENFLADMGRRPGPDYELDRYPDNDGNYEPGNCRWATRSEQTLNQRSNRMVEINGELLPLTEAHRRYGKASIAATWSRIWKGMDPVEAVLTPPKYRTENGRRVSG